MKKLFISICVLTMLLFPGYAMAACDVYFKSALIDVYDDWECNNEMNVYGETEAGGDTYCVTETIVYYSLYKDGVWIDNQSNNDNDARVTLTMDHSTNDYGPTCPGYSVYEVKSGHKIITTDGYKICTGSDTATGRCRCLK
ncbi:MAG: hypothetical protein PHU78_02600 [Heliobacteriaceae bacterium]|nr:hypothetical protein [Heliobacteriaceae bacterium]